MEATIGQMVDVINPKSLEIDINSSGTHIWINIDGVCRFRILKPEVLKITDERKEEKK